MQSELHERLEYLVNYSSQLIFVSGESIAQQQKTLEAFVFQQHDDGALERTHHRHCPHSHTYC